MDALWTFLGQHWFEVLEVALMIAGALGWIKVAQLVWLKNVLTRGLEVLTYSIEQASQDAATKLGADTIKATVSDLAESTPEGKQIDKVLDEQGVLGQSKPPL